MIIEELLITHLSGLLSVPVYAERQEDLDSSYVLVEKTAGGETEYIRNATIAIQSYAGTLYEAAELNEEVKSAMYSFIDHDEIAHCELNTDYNFTDTTSKQYRYQAVYDVAFYYS